jgi:hypothetical protein
MVYDLPNALVHLGGVVNGCYTSGILRCPTNADRRPRLGVKCNALLGRLSPMTMPTLTRLATEQSNGEEQECPHLDTTNVAR